LSGVICITFLKDEDSAAPATPLTADLFRSCLSHTRPLTASWASTDCDLHRKKRELEADAWAIKERAEIRLGELHPATERDCGIKQGSSWWWPE
jgi:hypothetical protein